MESVHRLGMWMRTLIGRRRMALLAAALLLPYAVLLVLTVRLARQDIELQRDSTGFRLRQRARSAGDAVLAELDARGRDEVRTALEPGQRYRNPATVLVGWVEDGRLVLPWEASPAARKAREAVETGPFATQVRGCERAEVESGAAAGAHCYERLAAAVVGDPLHAPQALLLAARALDGEGTKDRAVEIYRRLAATDPAIADEDGVPLRLYAVQRLLQAGDPAQPLLDRAAPLADWPWLPPMASFVASEIARRPGGAGGEAGAYFRMRVHAGTRLLEQAEALQVEFDRLGLVQAHQAGRRLWTAYGMDELWLVGILPGTTGSPPLIVFRAAGMLPPVEARFGVRISAAPDMHGEPLGPELPGLKAAFSVPADAFRHGPERWMFYSSMALLGAVMIFAAWLLWRDVQRDVRLAQMRSQFVSSVSHELRTPLTSIRMLAETLQMGRGRDPRTQDTYLDTIVRECERLSRLVDDILLFSRNEQNRKVYRFRPVEIGTVVDRAVRTLEFPLQENGFRLTTDVEADLPVLEADGDALEQALLNLLGNAMKYSGASREIQLSAARADGAVAVRVRDFGTGIPPGEQQKIFEGFYRMEASEGSSIPGTGLGLALVRQIVKAHGGRVEVHSVPGKGSTFTILLPVTEKTA